MHRLPDFVVFLEQRDGETGPGEEGCRMETTRSTSDDRNVQHLVFVVSDREPHQGRAGFIIERCQNFLTRTSHRPRNVIQNDTATRTTSRQKLALRT